MLLTLIKDQFEVSKFSNPFKNDFNEFIKISLSISSFKVIRIAFTVSIAASIDFPTSSGVRITRICIFIAIIISVYIYNDPFYRMKYS